MKNYTNFPIIEQPKNLHLPAFPRDLLTPFGKSFTYLLKSVSTVFEAFFARGIARLPMAEETSTAIMLCI
ncbi:MAG: hypothetical protein OEL83_16405 [Desulforhopalus sp.]|nr:hypothetical protein [Desulforhopalus sp.]